MKPIERALDTIMSGGKSGFHRGLFWSMFLIVPLILVACSGEATLTVGNVGQGDSLIIRIEDIKRLPEIRFEGNDQKHYLIAPSSSDNELVALSLLVYNEEAARLLMTVDETAVQLRNFDFQESYNLLDLTSANEKNVKIVDSTHPSENLYVPFIAGPIEVPHEHQIVGWVVFDVPKGTKLREIRWDAGGDTLYIRGKPGG